MQQNNLRDQRGVAMILELLLVAVVLALVGLAVYQFNQRRVAKDADAPAANTAESIADTAASTVVAESATDAALSASAEAATDEVSATEKDVTDLGGSSENAF